MNVFLIQTRVEFNCISRLRFKDVLYTLIFFGITVREMYSQIFHEI
jgi:hypothetical protein